MNFFNAGDELCVVETDAEGSSHSSEECQECDDADDVFQDDWLPSKRLISFTTNDENHWIFLIKSDPEKKISTPPPEHHS